MFESYFSIHLGHAVLPTCEHGTRLHFLEAISIHVALRRPDVSPWKSEWDKASPQTQMWQSGCCRGMRTQAELKLAAELWPLQNLQELQLQNLNKHNILSVGKLNENVILGRTPNNFLSQIGVLTEWLRGGSSPGWVLGLHCDYVK